jgi:hypothetical protein
MTQYVTRQQFDDFVQQLRIEFGDSFQELMNSTRSMHAALKTLLNHNRSYYSATV